MKNLSFIIVTSFLLCCLTISTLNAQQPCGANIAPGIWKEFMCRNLGADQTANPFIPGWQLIGNYYQWGRNGISAYGPTGSDGFQADSGNVAGWNTFFADGYSWQDGFKTSLDPCPQGFRIPTKAEWDGVIANNPVSNVGTWTISATNYTAGKQFGPDLFLPAAGYRGFHNGALYGRGYSGYYWSSTSNAGFMAWSLRFYSNIEYTGLNLGRIGGFSLRCIIDDVLTPGIPSQITGHSEVCENETGLIYSVIDVIGVSYTWTVPGDWSIVTGHGSNTITVNAGTQAGNIVVTPSNIHGNGPSQTLAVTTRTVPAQPSAITGNNNPCVGATENYSVTNIPGVDYNWTVPAGWPITSGLNTNQITVTVGATGGNIGVTPSNTCGNGPSQTLAVTTQTVPAQPSAITGNNNPCVGATENYSVTNVPGVSYNWTIPAGWSITSGLNTNQITVTVGATGGNIGITPSNTCGNGISQTLAVTTRTVPAQLSAITGNNNPCIGATENYTVTNVPGVDYNWTVPAGWPITSGLNTNQITVTVGATGGNIGITPSNTCGNGISQTLAVTTRTVPAQLSAITGNNNPCNGATENYSVTNVPGVSYNWTIPAGWSITTGQTTNQITVTVGSIAGNVEVMPSNACGNGSSQMLSITPQSVPPQPDFITGNANPCENTTGLIYNIPSGGDTYNWTVPAGWIITSGDGTYQITVTAGTSSGNITVTPSNICGNGTPRSMAVTTMTVPPQPSVITGNNNPCENETNLAYEVTNQGYNCTWTVPTGWSITFGHGTPSILVNAGTTAGIIEVTPYNVCGNGTPRSLAVTTHPVPAVPTAGTHIPDVDEIEWKWNTVAGATGYKWNTINDYASAIDKGSSTSHTEAGLLCSPCGITYTRYLWAYNACGVSTALTLTASTTTCPTAVVDVTNPATGRTWMDRNLGATQVATSSTDALAYGDLYQWGRLTDGHQCRNSATTNTLSTSDVPGHGNFILAPNNPYDWRSGQNDNLWQGVNGVNNPCPSGYKLPTEAELNAELASWISQNKAGAIASPLKFPTGGFRGYSNNFFYDVGSNGVYWSSNVSGIFSKNLWIGSTSANIQPSIRALGFSVRCIKDVSTPAQPSPINGPTNPCDHETGLIYNVTNEPGVIYTWTVPSGWNITGGQGTNQITVTAGTAAGIVEVTPSNVGGNGPSQTLAVATKTIGCYPPGYVHCDPANPTAVVDVTNPTTGRIWMDRNLGAAQVAASGTDVLAYGDLYQWGRLADGHQCRTSTTNPTPSSTDVPGHGNFITSTTPPYDWRSPQNDNLWQGVSGVNNPCPTGYRLPTEAELNTERLSWSSNNAAGAFASPLRLTVAGGRGRVGGSLFNLGSYGYFWSSTVNSYDSRFLNFLNTSASMANSTRADGRSVRCIKNY